MTTTPLAERRAREALQAAQHATLHVKALQHQEPPKLCASCGATTLSVTSPAQRAGTVYLSGPMTGLPEYNYPAFNAVAEKLRAQGYKVCNPADHGVVEGAVWADYLRADLAQLAMCETIHLLPGWWNSTGAQLELHIAQKLGMKVTKETDAEPVSALEFVWPESTKDEL